jgi:hypothetical protein
MFTGKYKILGIFAIVFFFTGSTSQIQLQQQQHLSFASNSTAPLSNNITSNNNDSMRSIIDKSLNNTTFNTFKNATTPAVGVDPKTNAIYVIYFKNENSGGNLYLQKSIDFGKTYSNPVRVNDVKDSIAIDEQWSAPALGIGPKNDIHVVWYKADHSDPVKYPYGQVTLQYARSLDGGSTFQPAINPAPNDPKGEQSYPYIAVTPDDEVHISYLNLDYDLEKDVSGTPTVVRVVSSQDGGKTFSNSSIADHSACQCCATVIKFGPDDELYVTSRSAFQNNSLDLNDNSTKTPYLLEDGQNQTVVRDITVYHSTDNGKAEKFSTPARVGNDKWFMNGCPDSGPGMDFDKDGTLHIAWFTGSEFAPNGPGFYYTTSGDKGLTFDKPLPIHLLSEQWIPPTTQYLKTDKYGNSWIVFVNSEGLKKSSTYEEDFSFVGDGTIHLGIVDKNGHLIKNGNFVSGDITKHYPYTTGSDRIMAISWIDGSDVKLAVIPVL